MPDDDAPAERLDAAAQLLYGLPPGEFTASRNQLAAEAKSAGDAGQAKAIAALRRPTAAAWLVNALAREDGEEIRAVLALGEQARSGDGGDAAELTRRRRAVIQAALRRGRDLAREAGESFADAVLREVESTLDAAIADHGAAVAVQTGRLQRTLRSGGFDAVDLTGAVAGAQPAGADGPTGPPKLTVIRGGRDEHAPAGGSSAPARRRGTGRSAAPDVSREEAAAQAALEELDRASAAARQAREAAEAIQQEIEQLRARRAELERELSAAQEAQSAAQQHAARARRLNVDAERKLAAAGRRATSAQQRLEAARGSPPGDG